jgi:hypothetical protein
MSAAPEFIPKWAFTVETSKPAATLTPSATSGNITLTAGSGVFTDDHLHQYVEGNLGRARITAITSTTVVKARVIVPFFDTTAIASQAWNLETGYEDIWSDTRGWPVSVAFYQDRLAFGGCKGVPNFIALSRLGDYFDFDPGQALDDDAIVRVLAAKDEVPAILHMMPDRHLQLFTASGEYYVPISESEPLTPSNFAVRLTTGRGVRHEVRPVNLDGTTVFCQRGGKVYRDFVFTGGEGANAYESPNLSLPWAHLVDTPVDATVRPSQTKEDGDLLLTVGAGGSIAACLRMRDAEINGAVEWTTEGTFEGVCCVDDDTYVVTERSINSATVRHLEFFDDDLYVDSAVTYTSGTTLTGLDHLEGEVVAVRVDGFWYTHTVASGQITLETAVVATCQVGLPYTPLAETLPPWKASQGGPVILDGMTRISRVTVSVQATQNLIVQGDAVSFRTFDQDIDDPIPEFTGTKIVDGLIGWQRDNKVALTQNGPAPLIMRAIEYAVDGW